MALNAVGGRIVLAIYRSPCRTSLVAADADTTIVAFHVDASSDVSEVGRCGVGVNLDVSNFDLWCFAHCGSPVFSGGEQSV